MREKQNTTEWEKEFDENFKCIQGDCAGGGHTFPTESEPEGGQCQFCAEYIYPLKAFITSLLQYQKIEHCSTPDCPECNLVAYQAGYDKAKREMVERVKELPDTYEDNESAVFRTTIKEVLTLLQEEDK